MKNVNLNDQPIQETGDATGGMIPYKNVPALIAYYLGIFSILPFLGLLLGITAVILGIIGLKKAEEKPVIKGRVHAWVGIVCGCIFGLTWMIVVVRWIWIYIY